MRMLSLIMEGGVPTEVLGRDLHGGGNVIAMCTQESTPRLGVVIAQALSVLPMERDDVRPHISRVVLQFRHGLVQIHTILISKQSMVTQTLSARTSGNVFCVALGGLYLRPVLLQGQSDERRGVGLGGTTGVVLILQ